jgi:hypothetical protein
MSESDLRYEALSQEAKDWYSKLQDFLDALDEIGIDLNGNGEGMQLVLIRFAEQFSERYIDPATVSTSTP